jgi:hypothetical protein
MDLVLAVKNFAISKSHNSSCEFEYRSWQDVLDTTSCDKVCQQLAAGRWFSPGTNVLRFPPPIFGMLIYLLRTVKFLAKYYSKYILNV